MSDHVLESGDSPELEALFENAAHTAKTPPPPPVAPIGSDAGDSPELEALFESVARTASLETPPVTAKPYGDNGDSDELQALFDSLAAAHPPEPDNPPRPCPRSPSRIPRCWKCIPVSGR